MEVESKEREMEREEREEERSMSLIWSSLIPRLKPGNETRYGSKLSP